MISNIKAARMLGWTSLAVGITEIFATHWLEDEMGVDKHDTLIRAYGIREIAAGVNILQQPGIGSGLAAALWSRVAGDALDIATLAAAATTTRRRSGLITVTAIVLAITGLDILIASLVQKDVIHGKIIAENARRRVIPTDARPIPSVEPTSTLESPVALGDG